ncbi:radical SAM enzyme [Aspergillus affinis]|uniref:radical SAM enzyme n=1 Tax=Aspergillus affinis TaxID=1070780 RepID=UPI0022FDD078|nr:radical SAM enzyme [Aspergillus affinis]KAI9034894.1 radical SAM enzyme [Aspergillus affinis]
MLSNTMAIGSYSVNANLVFITTILIIYLSQKLFKYFFSPKSKIPVSVNFHFSRLCNKSCGFCFHTAKTSHIEAPANARSGLFALKAAGMKKINFAGGEPFLHLKFLGEMIDYCKEFLHLESVSIVTNGSLVTEAFLAKHGKNIDILAVSCDSFTEATNIKIGRGSGNQVDKLFEIRDLCKKYGIKFKLNTVVCKLNFEEDMNEFIDKLQPFRWKCFQVLIVEGENNSSETLRDARKFTITDEEYELFCAKHRHQTSFVAEPNSLMAKTYLILDEYMRFLDRSGKKPSASILKVTVKDALDSVYWDESGFVSRGGIYEWTREEPSCSEKDPNLEW